MNHSEENNMTFWEFIFNDVRSYTGLVLAIVFYLTSIPIYTLWIIAIAIKIKNRLRKLRQLKANVLVSNEEEERQKWNLYNEETHLVKESYLLAICIFEFSFTIFEISVEKYASLKLDLERFHNTTLLPEYKCFEGHMQIISYEEPIVMLLRGLTWIFVHITILLVCSLMRYLIDRYLLRKHYNRITVIVYGLLSSVFIILFFNKYAFYFRIFAISFS